MQYDQNTIWSEHNISHNVLETKNSEKQPQEAFYKTRLQAYNFITNSLQHRCFLVNVSKFLRAYILKKICNWLRL